MAGLCSISAIFIGLKWRAVMERSEAAKRAASTDINYFVVPSRSGKLLYICFPMSKSNDLIPYRRWSLVYKTFYQHERKPHEGT